MDKALQYELIQFSHVAYAYSYDLLIFLLFIFDITFTFKIKSIFINQICIYLSNIFLRLKTEKHYII